MVVTGEQPYRWIIHDRDSIYSEGVDATVAAMGLTILKTPVRAPQANAFCERLIGSMRRECLDWLILLNERHLRFVLTEWVAHYNHGRPQASLGPGIPDPQGEKTPELARGHRLPVGFRVVAKPVLGGLHHECRLESAASIRSMEFVAVIRGAQADSFRDRPQTIDAVDASSSADAAKISAALLVQGADEAGAKGPHPGSHRRSRRHETAESDVGLSPNRSTDRLAFGIPITKDVVRRILAVRYQPEPDSAGPSWLTVLGHTKDGLWSLDLFRCESGRPAHTLGARRDGPMHAPHRGLYRASRRRGLRGAVPNVQSSDSRPILAEISQLGP